MKDELGGDEEFARAFGKAFSNFLRDRRLRQIDVARQTGLSEARISSYFHDSTGGKRPKPNAEVLFLLCTKLGFEFTYMGYRITSEALLNGHRHAKTEVAEQLTLQFDGQIDLIGSKKTVSVTLNRPPRRFEISVSLRAVS